jgi:hypothetical protein
VLEPQLGMFLLVVCSLQEDVGDLLETGSLSHGCKVGVFIASLGFTGKSLPQVLLGLGASITILHLGFLLRFFKLYELICAVMADGAFKIGVHGTLVNMFANGALPLFHCNILLEKYKLFFGFTSKTS